MPASSLGAFVRLLEQHGQLKRISAPVDPFLEITEIVNRVFPAKGPALLFENVKGSSFPLLINFLGTQERLELALGRSPRQVGHELATFANDLMPPRPSALWKHRSLFPRLLAMKPNVVSHGPVFQNKIEPADLNRLPIAQSWPADGGRFITFPLVLTKSIHDGRQNAGVYRMHVHGPNQTGMHWQIAKGGGFHYQQTEKENRPLSVSVVVGADPIFMMCGILPLPEGLDELAFSGFLRGKRTRVKKLSAQGLNVPVEAEFVLEGFVPPHERKMEGPYGDHFGHYSLAAPFPVFHIERIWHRPGAIFPIAVVGKPPQEDQVIGDAVQEMLLPLLKIMHPEIVDLWAYMEAGFHNLCVVSVHQRFQKEAIKTGLWVLGEGQLALTKCVVLVDPDVNARDFNAVLGALRDNFDPQNDFILLSGTSQDTLDFTGHKMNLGSKMILDATRGAASPRQERSVSLSTSDLRSFDSSIEEAVVLQETMLIVKTKSAGRALLEKMLNFPSIKNFSLVAAVSSDVPLDNPTLLLWGIFTRFDCARDTFFLRCSVKSGHPVYEGPLFIDATMKPGYPDPLVMRDDIVKLVDRRWKEYGI